MAQNGSHFLRLPAELRGQVYEFYVKEEDGYLHDPSTRKLRTFAGKPIDNSLIYTCRIVAQEMTGLALRLNNITFRTMLSNKEACDVPSNAQQFEYLLNERHQAIQIMLGFAHSLVTTEVMDELSTKWPGSEIIQEFKAQVEREGTICLRSGRPNFQQGEYGVDEAKKDRILADFMQILAAKPGFDALTAIGFTASLRDRWQISTGFTDEQMAEEWRMFDWSEMGDNFIEPTSERKRYTEATRHKILNWQPSLWWLPSREDLNKVGEFLPGTAPVMEHGFKWFFSAAAVAIQFLSQLPLGTRLQLRTLIIEENHPANAEPYTHARGLIPFLRENPHLRVERRVDVWHTTIITREYYRLAADWLSDIAAWMREAKELQDLEERFVLTLHGPSRELSQNLADKVIEAAAWEDTNREYLRQRNIPLIHWQHGVCHGFSELVREVVQRKIPVRFDAEYSCEPGDTSEVLRQHVGEWTTSVREACPGEYFLEPYEGWKAAREAYQCGPDSFDPLGEWNDLLETL